MSLTLSISALLISFLALFLSYQKRKDDLFSLRFSVFMDITDLWRYVLNYKTYSDTDIVKYRNIKYRAKFLFGKEITLYLDNLHENFADLHYLNVSKKISEEYELSKKLIEVHDELERLFEPYLALERKFLFAGAAAQTGFFFKNLLCKVWHTCKQNTMVHGTDKSSAL